MTGQSSVRGDGSSGISGIHEHLGYWLRCVSLPISARLDELLQERGITETEWLALWTMFEEPYVTHFMVRRILGLTTGATSKVLRSLEEKGLICRRLGDGCRRAQWLSLTAKGEAEIPELAELASDNDAYFFLHLDAHARSELENALQAMVRRHQLPPMGL